MEQVRRGHCRSALGVAALGAAGLVGACLPAPSPWLGTAGVTVGVVGDSLVHHAELGPGGRPGDPRRLSAELVAAGRRASVSSAVGADTPDLASITAFPDPGAELLVVALGTNDMRAGLPIPTAIANIEAFVAVIAPRCTVVVTIVDEPSWGLQELGPAFNAALVDLAAGRTDVVVADWASLAEANPGHLMPDGVHHTTAGQAAYRTLIVEGVAACDALVPAA